MSRTKETDKKKHWPFNGFFLRFAEAQKEYEQELHIDPALLTEAEKQREIRKLLNDMYASRKREKTMEHRLTPLCQKMIWKQFERKRNNRCPANSI